MSRTDDINVAGHRLSTGAMEVLAAHGDLPPETRADALKGQVPLGWVLKDTDKADDEVTHDVVAMVRQQLGWSPLQAGGRPSSRHIRQTRARRWHRR